MGEAGDGHLGHHPKGTLAIIAAFGAVYAVGWLVFYFLVYTPRGVITP